MKTLEFIPLQKSVTAKITIPGSKSITNRALVLASLTQKEVCIKNPLWSDDTEAMIECLETLGISIKKEKNEIRVIGSIFDIKERHYELNARLSGTTIRFILALASIVPGDKKLYGIGRLNERPIKDLVDGLKQLGANISYQSEQGFPPVMIKQSKLVSNTVKINGNVSSQYFTAMLLIAPIIGGLHIDVIGNQISKPYIDITIQMMKEAGIEVENQNYQTYIVPGGNYIKTEYVIEGDYSAAGYFAGIAALTGSTITIENLNLNTTQGDKAFLNIIQTMENKVIFDKTSVTITGTGVKPVSIDMENCPDQAQTLAVLAAFAAGVTTMTGVRSLRVKETERVKAVQAELFKMGIKTESPDEDTLIVYGGTPTPAIIDTYHDHRMAMSFAMAGALVPGIKIKNPEVVNKTFPEYWNTLKKIGIDN